MIALTQHEQDMLDGKHGAAVAMSMRIITELGRIRGAQKLVDVESVHIDGCLYLGQAGLDFANRLIELGGAVVVPTTVNVGSVDLIHPGLVQEITDREKSIADGARKLMSAYVDLGVTQSWTCAPYQADSRPEFGSHVAWAESNAIVFANSVLGARTDRYGDFLDIASALTGKAPYAGLHLDEHRRGDVIIDCTSLSPHVFDIDITYPILGYIGGHIAGTSNPVYVGLPIEVSEDRLKALGASAASSGGVALFHVVGRTPEARVLADVVSDESKVTRHVITANDLNTARQELCTASESQLDAISLGTPHASLDEIRELWELLKIGPGIHPDVQMFINTGRTVYAQAQQAGYVDVLESKNVTFVLDTCAYLTKVFRGNTKTVMTNSGKVAHYIPGNLGVDAVLATLGECVASARSGVVTWDQDLFNG